MTKAELAYLTNRFKSTPQSTWGMTSYSRRRFQDRNIDMTTFRSIWTDGFDIIEYHFHEGYSHSRVLIRSRATDKYDYQVCAVFSLTTNEIVTVYKNWRCNKHTNLVWSEYDENLDVLSLVKRKSMTMALPQRKQLGGQ